MGLEEDIKGTVHHDEIVAKSESISGEGKLPQTLGEPGVWEATLAEAEAANAHEYSLSIREALRQYPYAVLWSLCVSMSIIMEGYDTISIGSLYAYPTFAKQFGELRDNGTYQIDAKWQSAMGSGPQAGAIIGALANGYIIQRLGYRPAFLLGLLLMTDCFCFCVIFRHDCRAPSCWSDPLRVRSHSFSQLTHSSLQHLHPAMNHFSLSLLANPTSVPWGIFATIGPAYASELCPLPLRAFLTAYTNICFATGQLIGAGVLKSFLDRGDNCARRKRIGR